MLRTNNFALQKPEPATDNVNIEVLNANMDIIDKGLIIYLGTTSGSANTYTITSPSLAALSAGVAVSVKFNADSTGESTLNINSLGAVPIKKSNGNDATNLKAAGIYTLRYDGTNFILQGEGASGDATASDLLLGKTAATDAGEITGTMPDIGAQVITPGTSNKTISYGKHNGSGYVVGDPGLTSSNIKSGAEIFNTPGKAEVVDTTEVTNPANSGNILKDKVAFINGEKVVGSATDNGSVGTQNLTTQNAEYTIPAGFHNGLGKVKAVIAGLIASVIKAGATVGGILGTFTSDATATASQILSGITAYVNGNKVTGTMPNNGAISKTLAVNENYKIPAGYHNGNGSVSQSLATKAAATYTPGTTDQTIPANQYLTGAQTIKGDPNLIAANILEDVPLFGLVGTAPNIQKIAAVHAVSNQNFYGRSSNDGSDREIYCPTLNISGLKGQPKFILCIPINPSTSPAQDVVTYIQNTSSPGYYTINAVGCEFYDKAYTLGSQYPAFVNTTNACLPCGGIPTGYDCYIFY